MKRAIQLGAAALGALLVVLALGCDKKNHPTQPPPPSNASLEVLWPNEDGRTWNYRITARNWDDVGARYYPTRDSVPPIPTMSQLAALFGTQPIGSNPFPDTARFQLKFQGQITTGSGVTAQRLVETFMRPARGLGGSFRGPVATAMPSGFLRDLVRARPDFARRHALLEAGSLAMGDSSIHAGPPLFMFGYAWRRTSEWIGSYGDVDTALAWIYVTKNLTVGSEFTHRLVPSLAADVFLHGRILARQSIQTGAKFRDAVVCLYSVDYGISEAVDELGNSAGFFRFYSYGSVTYADSVGPVGSYERRLVGLGNPSLGFYEQSFALTSTSPPAARAVSSSATW